MAQTQTCRESPDAPKMTKCVVHMVLKTKENERVIIFNSSYFNGTQKREN